MKWVTGLGNGDESMTEWDAEFTCADSSAAPDGHARASSMGQFFMIFR